MTQVSLLALTPTPEVFRLSPTQVLSRFLFCAGNRLAVLPAEIGSLQDLKYLNVMGNNLRSLPSEIGQLANLSRYVGSPEAVLCTGCRYHELVRPCDPEYTAVLSGSVPRCRDQSHTLAYLWVGRGRSSHPRAARTRA